MSRRFFSRSASLAAVAVLSLEIVMIIEGTRRPTNGDYELSPVEALGPVLAPIFLLGPTMCFLLTLAFGFFLHNSNRRDWRLLFAIGVFVNVVSAALPVLRGYYLYGRDDLLTHFGYVIDIDRTGSVQGDVYPPLHILLWGVIRLTSLPPNVVFLAAPGFLMAIASLWLYAAARWFIVDDVGLAITMAASLLIVRETWILPTSLATYLLILLIGVDISNRFKISSKWSAILVIMAVLLPFFHPVVALIAVLGLTTVEVAGLLSRVRRPLGRGASGRSTSIGARYGRRWSSASLIMGATFLLWLWANFSFWQGNVGRLVSFFAGETVSTGRTEEILSILALFGLNFVSFGIRLYGLQLGMVLMEFGAFALWLGRRGNLERSFLRVALWILPIAALVVATTFTAAFRIEPTRPLVLISFVGLPLLALFPMYFSRERGTPELRMRWAKSATFVAVFLIATLGAFGSLSLYEPRYSSLPNPQVTPQELAGTGWLFLSGVHPGDVKEVNSRHFRLAQAAFGTLGAFEMGITQSYNTPGLQVPDHFGYDKGDTIGRSLPVGSVLIVSTYDVSFNLQLFSSLDRFSGDDFARLNLDPAANLVYNNGGYDAYLVASATP